MGDGEEQLSKSRIRLSDKRKCSIDIVPSSILQDIQQNCYLMAPRILESLTNRLVISESIAYREMAPVFGRTPRLLSLLASREGGPSLEITAVELSPLISETFCEGQSDPGKIHMPNAMRSMVFFGYNMI